MSQPFTGSTEICTRIAGFRVQSAHNRTMEPTAIALVMHFWQFSPLRQCLHVLRVY